MDGRAAPCPTFFLTRMLSNGEKTALSLEDTMTSGVIRVRVGNADIETSLLLTREEGEWLRDALIAGLERVAREGAEDQPTAPAR